MYFEVDGRQVFATTGGLAFDKAKPAVIFLHGSGLDHTFWGLYSRFFAFRHYAVIAPDYPGHTNSEGPPLTSIETLADWLHAVISALAIRNFSLVAHSQGCLVALEFASRYGKGLRSVSFIASGLATPVNVALIDAAEKDPESAIAMMIAWGFGPAGHFHQGPIPGGSMAAGGRNVMRRNVPDALAADLRACDAYAQGKRAAAAIACPVQVILGGKDRMAPARAGMELVSHLQDAELHIVEDAGHMLPLEAPNLCRAYLREFILRHNPTR